MIIILGMLLLGLIFGIVLYIRVQEEDALKSKREVCKSHNWFEVVDMNDKPMGLICVTCGFVAGME